MKRALLVLVILLLPMAAPVVASDSPYAATLKGINAVNVLVEDLSPGAKKLGLNEEMIQTDVELKLRLAGLGVVTKQEYLPGSPYLYVVVTVAENTQAVSLEIELVQGVRLERNGAYTLAPTWSKGELDVNPTAQTVRDNIKDLVNSFLNALLSVKSKSETGRKGSSLTTKMRPAPGSVRLRAL